MLLKHMILKLRVETCEEDSLEEIQIARPVNILQSKIVMRVYMEFNEKILIELQVNKMVEQPVNMKMSSLL